MPSLLYGPTLTSIHDYCKNHSSDYTDFCHKVMSLLLNMLSTFVKAFLPRSKHVLISLLQSLSAVILEPKKIKFVTASTVSHICHEVMGLDAKDLKLFFFFFFFHAEFQANFFIHLFWPQKKLFSSTSLSAIRVVSSAYLRLLIFLLAMLIPACASPSLAFCMNVY